jgi:hypothetical protein
MPDGPHKRTALPGEKDEDGYTKKRPDNPLAQNLHRRNMMKPFPINGKKTPRAESGYGIPMSSIH